MIDVPIQGMRLVRDKSWEGITNAMANQDACPLFLEVGLSKGIGPESESGWGLLLRYWCNDVGSVVVVRADGKNLYPDQVLKLSRYCRLHIGLE